MNPSDYRRQQGLNSVTESVPGPLCSASIMDIHETTHKVISGIENDINLLIERLNPALKGLVAPIGDYERPAPNPNSSSLAVSLLDQQRRLNHCASVLNTIREQIDL